jgi:hypothetical protein
MMSRTQPGLAGENTAADGTPEYRGRLAPRVKMRGFDVEPGETAVAGAGLHRLLSLRDEPSGDEPDLVLAREP